jgi:uncharacterized lipoprotein YajG
MKVSTFCAIDATGCNGRFTKEMPAKSSASGVLSTMSAWIDLRIPESQWQLTK